MIAMKMWILCDSSYHMPDMSSNDIRTRIANCMEGFLCAADVLKWIVVHQIKICLMT